MGHRLHSAMKYDVKYGDNASFNWAQEHINPIIDCLAEGETWFSGEYVGGADQCEAPRELLLANIERIISPNSEWLWQEALDELIEDMENDKECNIDRQYLYKQLKSIVEQSDPNCYCVHFAWF